MSILCMKTRSVFLLVISCDLRFLSALQFLFLYNSLSDFYSINAFLFNISCNEGNVKVEKIQETLRMLKWIVKISFLALSWQCLFTESLVGWMPYEVAFQPVFLCPNAVVRMSFVVFVFPCLFHPFCLTNVGSVFFQTISHWGEIWWFWDGAAVHYGFFFLDFFFSLLGLFWNKKLRAKYLAA